jgi:predicted AlkP superfamily phosphohydrolase/phosphomutase
MRERSGLRVIGLTILICASLLSACSDNQRSVDNRLIIIGFDGMDPGLAQKWMDDDSLPNFKKLAAMGEFHRLKTSNPAQSPVAWSDFATGENAGRHGIYDFLRRDLQTYAPAFSISESVPPKSVLTLFGMDLPLEDGKIINRRNGMAFWSDVEQQGGISTVLRVPVTYPPDQIHRMLAGMGVPDLLGTQGTYTLYTTLSSELASSESTRAVQITPDRNSLVQTKLEGPPHPLKKDAPPLNVTLKLQPDGDGVLIDLDGTKIRLRTGEWSDWIGVSFSFLGFSSVKGIVRLNLLNNFPKVQLYVSPIQIDPRDPIVPLSSPPGYATDLAREIGLYHTIGMPEETWSLNEGHISDQTYLEMIRTITAEREAMLYNALDKRDSDLVVGVFVQTDRVSHMFFRGLDKEHALYSESSTEARGAIHWIYREADRILGATMDRMGPKDRLIVLSDHGFAPFRWAVNLNRWLADEGLLVMKNDDNNSRVGFSNVDWSRSKAYAIGLNSVFINRSGREKQGIVDPQEAAIIKQFIMKELPEVVDPATGKSIVTRVFDGEKLYQENANGDAPDLIIGYSPGYRASWQTALGGAPSELIEVNSKKWSGDHCIFPSAVPGVLFTSFQLKEPLNEIRDVANFVRKHWTISQ